MQYQHRLFYIYISHTGTYAHAQGNPPRIYLAFIAKLHFYASECVPYIHTKHPINHSASYNATSQNFAISCIKVLPLWFWLLHDFWLLFCMYVGICIYIHYMLWDSIPHWYVACVMYENVQIFFILITFYKNNVENKFTI